MAEVTESGQLTFRQKQQELGRHWALKKTSDPLRIPYLIKILFNNDGELKILFDKNGENLSRDMH